MTKILATDTMGRRQEFKSFSDCASYFGIMEVKIKRSIDSGALIKTDKGSWFFDYSMND